MTERAFCLSAAEFNFKRPKPAARRQFYKPLPDHVVKAIQKHSRPTKNKMAFYERLAKQYKCSAKTVCNIILGYRR